MRWLPALLLIACTAGSPEPVAEPVAPQAWVTEAATVPVRFGDLLDATGRDGWIAMHDHRYADAWAHFGEREDPASGIARGRAAFALALLHSSLSRATTRALDTLVETYEDRGQTPPGSNRVARAFAHACRGEPAAWPADADGLVAFLDEGGALWDDAAPTDGPWAERMAAHRKARSTDDPDVLLALADTPVLLETRDGITRSTFDPCLHASLAEIWWSRAASSLARDRAEVAAAFAGEGLGARIFAPWLTQDALQRDLAADVPPDALGSGPRSLVALDVADAAEPTVQEARDLVARLDAAIDTWGAGLDAAASDEGRALLADLELLARFRQEHLTSRAAGALLDGHAAHALALAELAHDATARQVGPANGPRFYAVLAEARLVNGRAREALDALHPLSAAHPEVVALQEVTGDLAVLQGLTRTGSSKEN